mgnify:CR=1 FL=1|jgi:hypothetical protein|tara:strand:- start:642 stop:818 length:177 start_codon:yes stop_codon:yes gene_type:complete
MNPDKWKSVVVPIESYRVLKEMAAKERRTLSGQFTLLLEQVTGKDITVGEETPKKKKA